MKNQQTIDDPSIIKACKKLLKENQTPCYLYSQKKLQEHAKLLLNMPIKNGHLVRYAIKANSNRSIIKFLDNLGLHFDASSEYEVERLLKIGIAGEKIMLTSQQLAKNPEKLFKEKVTLNSCSLNQLDVYARLAVKFRVPTSIRFNPGSEHDIPFKTNVSGRKSSFGIWHEHLDRACLMMKKIGAKLGKLHLHVGSGTNDETWIETAKKGIDHLKRWPDVSTINLGGGLGIDRLNNKIANLNKVAKKINQFLADFEKKTGRKIKVEIEPGTFIVAKSGYLLLKIDDLCDTGSKGYRFIKLDGGMNDYLRPSLYHSQHRISHLKKNAKKSKKSLAKSYVLVGHCCENGDILSPGTKQEPFSKVKFFDEPEIGDGIIFHDAGAYGSSMANNYNSYPLAPEYWLDLNKNLCLIRKQQKIEEVFSLEKDLFS